MRFNLYFRVVYRQKRGCRLIAATAATAAATAVLPRSAFDLRSLFFHAACVLFSVRVCTGGKGTGQPGRRRR